MKTVKVHCDKLWVLEILRRMVLGEVMAEEGCTSISMLTDDQAKDLRARADE